MRKKIVAGNWKMNNNLQEGIVLAGQINDLVEKAGINGVDVVIGTPFIHLTEVNKIVGDKVGVAAQNCADEKSGAYTGEISTSMVASTGTQCVILGHSERRSYYGETSEILVKKTNLCLENKLTPIFCIGEVLEERESGKHFDIVKSQIADGLFHLSAEDFGKVILAYEPVWAIGTGVTASADQAQEMHAFIRKTLVEKYGKDVADNCSILYGGSCKPSNAKELFSNEDVDGGLIGGASLVAEDFMGIVTAF
ncbi:triose-phosphate isomerase [Labilibaculum sp. DW002]|uniref:Triosephosphate isomerase n=1 Tax=Paralabilibaculum antarcticum TaxID=2912572 RepID=A0ABT5VNW4_9BACT|nr:triose-phosphate isomerase [Labilibaculum sp. DW002]MDE5417126.1 triose-phosphate isomerase [Labilibaculum sp. DW002]